MADAKTITIDPRDVKIDRRLMRRIWRLLKPYWTQRAHWKSWALLIFTMAMAPALSYYNIWIARRSSESTDAIVAQDQAAFTSLFWLLFALGLGNWVYASLVGLLTDMMEMHWYKWLSRWMIDRYLAARTYYDIAVREDVDNPDERIQENVMPVVKALLTIPTRILATILGVTTNIVLINQVSPAMTSFVIVYSVGSIVIQTLVFLPLIKLNFDVVASKADMRYGLLRIRDHAETIAFFRGERMESAQVADRLDRQVKAQMRVIYYTSVTSIVAQLLSAVWSLAPLLFIYPLYFRGEISYGTIALATAAAAGLMGGITQLNTYLPFLTSLAPSVVRLAQIVERQDAIIASTDDPAGDRIVIRPGTVVVLDDIGFTTPGGERWLVHNLSIAIREHESLMILGQTGVGKSSLLRAMAGLWTRGTGVLTMPPEDQVMFVPQRPYMMLGTLRDQLLYPRGDTGMSDEDLQTVLERVCLPDLAAKNGSLSAEKDWSRILSLGEQQRISFARVLISRPRYVFLDEATSAMDLPTEAAVYRTLAETGCTFVSVGHRDTILRFHDRALRLLKDGGWDVLAADTIPIASREPLGASRRPPVDTDGTIADDASAH